MENQPLSELNIDTTSSLPSTSQPVTATSIATTATTISNIVEKEIETNDNVSTPPVERPTRRRSSSSDHHLHSTPIKTRSSLVLASKLEQIEDEADSNRTKTADDSSPSNQDTTSENLLMVAASSSSTTVSENNSASGVNRRTAVLFKRNKKHK